MKDLMFREAKTDDLPDIVALLRDDDLGAARENAGDSLDTAYLQAFEAIAADPHNCVYVVEYNRKVVGCLQLTLIPNLSFTGAWRGQIEGVRIDQSIRGTGIGTKFFKWVIEFAKTKNCKIIQLTMNASRLDSHHFYKKLGFEDTHTGFKLYF